MAIDISRQTDGVPDLLPPEISSEIWGNIQEESAVMRLARQVKVPGGGVRIPVVTGDATASWVQETDEKSVSRATLGTKDLKPYTLAVIEPFSLQFRRDLSGLYAELQRRLPNALAKAFDATVFGTTPPGSDFATLGDAPAVALSPGNTAAKGSYQGLVDSYRAVAAAEGTLSGWALSTQAKALLLAQVDTTGRPLLLDSIISGNSVPTLLGEPVYYTKGVYAAGTPNQVGFAGDWSSAIWGSVDGIKMSVAEEASVTDGTVEVNVEGGEGGKVTIPKVLNLWQRNMFALRVEIEIGFQIRDINRFVKLTDGTRA